MTDYRRFIVSFIDNDDHCKESALETDGTADTFKDYKGPFYVSEVDFRHGRLTHSASSTELGDATIFLDKRAADLVAEDLQDYYGTPEKIEVVAI